MRKKEIIAMLMLYIGGIVVSMDNYNAQSQAMSYECIKIDSPTDKIEKLSKECEEYKRQEYVQQKVEELRNEYPEVEFTVPPMYCCTDNASMIGVAGTIAYLSGRRGDASLTADSSLEIQ